MGKLVPKKSAYGGTIPSFEHDLHNLIDTFILKVQAKAELNFITFKGLWRDYAFSFVHQAVPLNVPARDFLQLLFAVALNRLADPSPYLDYRPDPDERKGLANIAGKPAEGKEARKQHAGKRDVSTRARIGGRFSARAKELPATQGTAVVTATTSNVVSGQDGGTGTSSAAQTPAAEEEDPLDQEYDLFDELFGNELFLEHQAQYQHTHIPAFGNTNLHAQLSQHEVPGAAVMTADGRQLNTSFGAPPLPSHLMAGSQRHLTVACSAAGPSAPLPESQECHNLDATLASPGQSLLAAAPWQSHCEQQQQQEGRGEEDSRTWWASPGPSLTNGAADACVQPKDQSGMQWAQLLPSALAHDANGPLGVAPVLPPWGPGPAEEDDYDSTLTKSAPGQTAMPLAPSWGCMQSDLMQSPVLQGNLEPKVEASLKARCVEATEGHKPGPQLNTDNGKRTMKTLRMSEAVGTQTASETAAASAPALADTLPVHTGLFLPMANAAKATTAAGAGGMVGAGLVAHKTVNMGLGPRASKQDMLFSSAGGVAVLLPTKGQSPPFCKLMTPSALLPSISPSSEGHEAPNALQEMRPPSTPLHPLDQALQSLPSPASPGTALALPDVALPGGATYDLAAQTALPPLGHAQPASGPVFQETQQVSPHSQSQLQIQTELQLQAEPQSTVRVQCSPEAAASGRVAHAGRSLVGELDLVSDSAADAFVFVAPSLPAVDRAAARKDLDTQPAYPLEHPGELRLSGQDWARPPSPRATLLQQQHQEQQHQQQRQLASWMWPSCAPAAYSVGEQVHTVEAHGHIAVAAEASVRAAEPLHAMEQTAPAGAMGANSDSPVLQPEVACGIPPKAAEQPSGVSAETRRGNNPTQLSMLLAPALPPPGPDVPLAARVGAIYTLYCLYGTQLCQPAVRIYLPLPLLSSLAETAREARAAGLKDVVVIVRDLWRKGALVPGGVVRFPGATTPPYSGRMRGWMAAAAARAQAAAAGVRYGRHHWLDASRRRRLAAFHEVLVSNPVLRQALLHLRTALPLLADMESFERLCDLYGAQRSAIFRGNSADGSGGGGSSNAEPDVLFEARVGGDTRRMVRGMFAEVLRALRKPPSQRRRLEKRRQRELEAQCAAARAEAEAAVAGPCTVAEALAQVAVQPPAPPRRLVAGELGALMRRRAMQAGAGAQVPGACDPCVSGSRWLGPASTNAGPQRRVVIIRHRSELASAGLLSDDGLRCAALPGIPARVLQAEEAKRQRVQSVADTWLSRHDRLMQGDQGEGQPRQTLKGRGKLTGASGAGEGGPRGLSAAAVRNAEVPGNLSREGRRTRREARGTSADVGPSLQDGANAGTEDAGEEDTDADFDVDAELEAAFDKMEAAADSPSEKKVLTATARAGVKPNEAAPGTNANAKPGLIAGGRSRGRGVRGRGRGRAQGRGRGRDTKGLSLYDGDDSRDGDAVGAVEQSADGLQREDNAAVEEEGEQGAAAAGNRDMAGPAGRSARHLPALADVYPRLSVMCRGIPGVLDTRTRRVSCSCDACTHAGGGSDGDGSSSAIQVAATNWPGHCGLAGGKGKWQTLVQVVVSDEHVGRDTEAAVRRPSLEFFLRRSGLALGRRTATAAVKDGPSPAEARKAAPGRTGRGAKQTEFADAAKGRGRGGRGRCGRRGARSRSADEQIDVEDAHLDSSEESLEEMAHLKSDEEEMDGDPVSEGPAGGRKLNLAGRAPSNRKRLKSAGTDQGLALSAPGDHKSEFIARTAPGGRVQDAKGARLACSPAAGGAVDAFTNTGADGKSVNLLNDGRGDEMMGLDNLLEDLGEADAELIRQTQLALKAQSEAMELLRISQPPAKHVAQDHSPRSPVPVVAAASLVVAFTRGPASANAYSPSAHVRQTGRPSAAPLSLSTGSLAAEQTTIRSGGPQQQRKRRAPTRKGDGDDSTLIGDTAVGGVAKTEQPGAEYLREANKRRRRERTAVTAAAAAAPGSAHEALVEALPTAGNLTGPGPVNAKDANDNEARKICLGSADGAKAGTGGLPSASSARAAEKQVMMSKQAVEVTNPPGDDLSDFDAMFTALKALNGL